ncbi:MAG: hypothetical protein ACI35S_08175 [Anaeroplasma sp.]
MKLQYCILKATFNTKYNIVVYKNALYNDLLIFDLIAKLTKILDNLDFIDSKSCCCFKIDELNVFNIISNEVNELIIYSYFLNNDINPISLLSINNLNLDKLNLLKFSQSEINFYINSDNESNIKAFIQAIIDGNKIFFKADLNTGLFLYRLAYTLLPNKYINRISFGFGKCFDINYLINSKFDEEFNGLYFNFYINDYPYISICEYVNCLFSKLNDSLISAIEYKNLVDKLLANDLSLSDIDLIYLMEGKIDRFKDTFLLANALNKISSIDFDQNNLAIIIFKNINRFEINSYIIDIYKYIFKNSALKKDIIELFFLQLDSYLNVNLEYNEYIKEFERIVPFDSYLYIDYLKERGGYKEVIDNANSFNKLYLLLDLTIKYIIKNNKAIVPNDDLLYFIFNSLKTKNWIQLDIYEKRIKSLNSKAFGRLVFIIIDKLEKEYNGINNYYSSLIDSFKALEYISYLDSIYLYQKLYSRVDRKEYIKIFKQRRDIKTEYYENLLSLFQKHRFNEFLDKYNNYEITLINNITFVDLERIYKAFYLDKYKNDNGIFISKIMEYLEASDEKDLINNAIDIYNRFYKSLNINYKDVYDSIRKINDFIYKKPYLLLENDSKYYIFLNELNNILHNRKYINNQYFNLIELGIRIKSAYLNKDSSLIKDVISNNYFVDYNEDMIRYFVAFYLKYLFIVFNYLDDLDYINNFIIFDFFVNDRGFTKVILKAFDDINYNEGFIFKYLVMAINNNNDKYMRILKLLFDNISNETLKKYFVDYLKCLDDIEWISSIHKDNIRYFLNNYIKYEFKFRQRVYVKKKMKG